VGAAAVLLVLVALAIVAPWRGASSDAVEPATGADTHSTTTVPTRPTVLPTVPPTGPPGGPPVGPLPTTPPVIDAVPVAWRPQCRRAPALDARAVEAVVCVVSSSTTVDVRRYADRETLDAAYAQLARHAPRGGADPRARCAQGQPEDRAWRSTAHGAIRGRYACATDAAGAHLVWSDTTRLVIARASRRDGNLAATFAWWTRAPL
jgi:hypothetical protein